MIRKIIISIIFIAVVIDMVLAGQYVLKKYYFEQKGKMVQATIHDIKFSLQVADSEEEWKQGLQEVKSLPSRQGMLFVFPKKDRYVFWMKNTFISLDLLWIHGDTIVEITKSAQPELQTKKDAELRQYRSTQPVDKVIELNAGEVELYGISIGDVVKMEK
ncbi:MAG TPA: DUF192 domain-containing protein [Patescibacteria group bacterium]|nr:DUF192 domain-containing protein [Patescibacteria group bacterium]